MGFKRQFTVFYPRVKYVYLSKLKINQSIPRVLLKSSVTYFEGLNKYFLWTDKLIKLTQLIFALLAKNKRRLAHLMRLKENN